MRSLFFFFNDTATTEIYTLSLHDALPISRTRAVMIAHALGNPFPAQDIARICADHDLFLIEDNCDAVGSLHKGDRKSTRLNSSHLVISYAVFCLKKKKT